MVALQCAFAAVGGAVAGLAGAGSFLLRERRQRGRGCLPEGACEVNDTLHASAWREGQLVVVRLQEGIVVVRATSRGPVVTLSEFFADTEYPGRCLFIVRHASANHVHLLPLLAPGMALAATPDSRVPLEVQRMCAKAEAQLWSQAASGFMCTSGPASVRLAATAMQAVPAEKISSWLRKVAQEAVLSRQKDAMEQQLAEGDRLAKQADKQARSLAAQLEQEREKHSAAQRALSSELDEACRAQRALAADCDALAEQQAAQLKEQEQLAQQLASTRSHAEQLQRQVTTLEQQAASAAAALEGKDQQLAQLAQQVSNLQVAFDFVHATAAERQEELQLWKDKHAKLDTAMQAIKARMRMVDDGEQHVRRLQASGVLRQADLRLLKQRLQRLGHQQFDELPGGGASDMHGEDGNDLDVTLDNGHAHDNGQLTTAGFMCQGPAVEGQAESAGVPCAGNTDAVEEVLRALQFESQCGSMEALLRSTGGSTAGGSDKADSLAAWFGRASKASVRSAGGGIADSAGSSSSVVRAFGAPAPAPAQQTGSKIPRYVHSEGGARSAPEQRLPNPSATEATATSAGPTSDSAEPPLHTPFIIGPGPQRPWVRPAVIVPHDDDATVNMASTRHPGIFVAEAAAPSRLTVKDDLSVVSKQSTTRLDQGQINDHSTPALPAGTPTSNRSHNEEYDILSEDNDGYDPGLSPSHHIPGSMLLAELDTIKLMSTGKRQPPLAVGDDDEDEVTAA